MALIATSEWYSPQDDLLVSQLAAYTYAVIEQHGATFVGYFQCGWKESMAFEDDDLERIKNSLVAWAGNNEAFFAQAD